MRQLKCCTPIAPSRTIAATVLNSVVGYRSVRTACLFEAVSFGAGYISKKFDDVRCRQTGKTLGVGTQSATESRAAALTLFEN